MNILTPRQYPGLPKWPAVYITGKSVTEAQAKHILLRTDRSLVSPSDYSIGGNDRAFQAWIKDALGWTPLLDMMEDRFQASDDPWRIAQAWSAEMGMLSLHYAHTDLLSSSYIGGPSTWCQPDGTILYEGHNWGKYPSVDEIVEDWTNLVDAFPFLDLTCTLYNGEWCEDRSPVATVIVQDQQVIVVEPDLTEESNAPTVGTTDHIDHFLVSLQTWAVGGSRDNERGWPTEWIEEFAQQSRKAMSKVAPALQISI